MREHQRREHRSFQYSFLIVAPPTPPTVGERHFVLGIASSVNVGGDRCTVDVGM